MDDIQKIRELIKKANSLQEVERLTRILQSGQIPSDLIQGAGSFPANFEGNLSVSLLFELFFQMNQWNIEKTQVRHYK